MSGSPSSRQFARSLSQLRSLEATGHIREIPAFVELGPLGGATQARFVDVEVVRDDELIRVRWPIRTATADLARLTRRLLARELQFLGGTVIPTTRRGARLRGDPSLGSYKGHARDSMDSAEGAAHLASCANRGARTSERRFPA